MNTLRHSRARRTRSLIALSMMICLAACAVRTPPAITASSGASATSPTQILVVEPDSEQEQRRSFHNAVVQELQRRGVENSSDAAMIADLAIAVSSGTVGVYASEAGNTDSEPDQLVTMRKSRWYDACKAIRVEASLVAYRRSDGELQKSSKAESMICEGQELPLADLASLLVDDLLED